MLTFRDLVTLDISDSPADRAAAPLVYFIGFPIFAPCTLIYLTAKGTIYVGGKVAEKIYDRIETIKDKVEDRKYQKELEMNTIEEPVTPISTDSSVSTHVPVNTSGKKRPNKLTLRR